MATNNALLLFFCGGCIGYMIGNASQARTVKQLYEKIYDLLRELHEKK